MRSTRDDHQSAPDQKRGHQASSPRKRVFYVEVIEVTPSEAPVNDTHEERISLAIDGRFLLTPSEAARRLSIGRTLIYKLMRQGALAYIQVGDARRIPVAALEAYIQAGSVNS